MVGGLAVVVGSMGEVARLLVACDTASLISPFGRVGPAKMRLSLSSNFTRTEE
jgi:hypothetical protein